MKKFVLILVVLTVVFASCASPVDEPDVVENKNPFEGRWRSTTGYITEWRGNEIRHPSGDINTFTFDDTYLYWWMSGNLSHIYATYKYEFRNNGNELHLTRIPNVYDSGSSYASEGSSVLQKIGD